MASAITHFLVGASLALPLASVPRVSGVLRPVGVVVAAGVLATLPDLDTTWRSAIGHDNPLHHRGLTHAPLVLALLSFGLAIGLRLLVRRLPGSAAAILGAAWMLAAVSHPVLDAMTNGGPGVMLLYPLSQERLFLPWRPIQVAPLAFSRFPRAAARVLSTEWPFCLAALAAGLLGRTLLRLSRQPQGS